MENLICGIFWFCMGAALKLTLNELTGEPEKKMLVLTFMCLLYIFVG